MQGSKKTSNADTVHEALDDIRLSRQVRLPSAANQTIIEDDDIDYIPGSPLVGKIPDVIPAVIHGIRVDEADKGVEYTGDGGSIILAGADAVIRLFGFNFTRHTQIKFVVGSKNRSEPCSGDMISPVNSVSVLPDDLTDFTGKIRVKLPLLSSDYTLNSGDPLAYSLCTYYKSGNIEGWIHQGREPWMYVYTYSKLLPLWFQIILIVVLLTFSGLFSGLNLGLMSLDRTELKILTSTGTDQEKRYANAIIPVRNHGNYLLCTLLLGNVLVNSSLTILLDDLTSGLVAVIGSTMGIVIFGEIVPQAICSRYGLAVGAHTIWVTKFFMLITFPLAFPISKLLDVILGEEIGAYYNRERLKELIRVTQNLHGLERDEVNIIAGALEMKKKTVADVMTKIEDVFMLSEESILDFDTVTEIVNEGYSRVPVFSDGDRRKICGIIFTKDLALLDTDDSIPVKRFCKFYHRDLNFVYEDVTLDVMFSDFKEGSKGHMAFVQRVNAEGEGDPFYETIGLVTLEDVIEEMIQSEIVDETDVWEDNRHRKKRTRAKNIEDFSPFAPRRDQSFVVSPQLTLAAFQFLSTSVDPFMKEHLSESVLRRMMLQPIIRHIKVKDREKGRNDPYTILYTKGKPADYFILILEGHVEVVAGNENLVFETGPFTYYGLQAITWATVDSPSNGLISNRGSVSGSIASQTELPPRGYIPDYTVRAITDITFVRVKRGLYQAARSATEMERKKDNVGRSMDLESELDKVLNAGNEEGELLNHIEEAARRFNNRPPSKRNSAIVSDTRNGRLTPDSLLMRSAASKLSIPNGTEKRRKSSSVCNSLSVSTDSLVEPRDRSSSLKSKHADMKESFTVSLPLNHMTGTSSRLTSRTSIPILSSTSKFEDPPHSYGSFDSSPSLPSVRVGAESGSNPSDSTQYESAADDKTNLLNANPV